MKIAISYVVVGLVLAVLGGTIIGKLKMECTGAKHIAVRNSLIS